MIQYLQKKKKLTGCAGNAVMFTTGNPRRKNVQTAIILKHIFRFYAKITRERATPPTNQVLYGFIQNWLKKERAAPPAKQTINKILSTNNY